ncbi:UDP-glucose 4-epimerase GalE [Phenylobacterium sp.]|uniref:UDP-glucose 4-epimerase GalE n=1 Tax=Phenylobacterium sp. TaxID=1871053 RepID=UPI00271EED21|nr:UDP-glucose 4-epimerase GalE [Phenylobacterium sp.]MDO8801624.1 UDP-glucose 4-epimerase GalE [Phenylobacterium sp.]
MKVLVTGGAGFIGSHVCKALAEAGHEPVVLDNLRTGHLWAARFGPFVHGDILEIERVAEALKTHRVDIVMHFAALAYVGESISEPDIYYRTNVIGSLSLLNAMRLAGVSRIVFSSTCATFGNVDRKIGDNEAQNPINPYGASKLMVERILRDYAAAYGIGSVALRYFNAAGCDPSGELGEVHDPETHLLPIALQVAAGTRSQLDVFGTDYPTPDGTCIRDYIHVCDLADAHVAALNVLETGAFKAFNLGNGNGFSVRQVIDRVEAVTGRKVVWQAAPRRLGDPPLLVADATAARVKLGWAPRFSSLDDMISHGWSFMNNQQSKLAAT